MIFFISIKGDAVAKTHNQYMAEGEVRLKEEMLKLKGKKAGGRRRVFPESNTTGGGPTKGAGKNTTGGSWRRLFQGNTTGGGKT